MMLKPTRQPTTSHIASIESLRHEVVSMGFDDVSVAHFDSLPQAKTQLKHWLTQSMHGDMSYLQEHVDIRQDPTKLLHSAKSAILIRINYLQHPQQQIHTAKTNAADTTIGQISLYAQGRDYHKVIRQRLAKVAQRLSNAYPDHQFRAFTDSAPVMEVELAQASGLGWRGKHTLLIHREAGSFFFLGGLLTTLPLANTAASSNHCGQCTKCIDVCPTQAIIAPYKLDARRCISYLTIEHQGSIPVEFRSKIGNKIYGCDDCQTHCPWNKYAQPTSLTDFNPRHNLDNANLLELWAWDEAAFLQKTEGSAIRRIGFERWQRNIAIALGNALANTTLKSEQLTIQTALSERLKICTELLKEHIHWALSQA